MGPRSPSRESGSGSSNGSLLASDRLTRGTHSYTTTALVHGTPDEVHRMFVKRVWWGGGMPSFVPSFVAATQVVQPQKDDSGNGAIRGVPGFILEEILDAKLGEYIKYYLKRKAIFLASYHAGEVRFYPAGPDMTRVTWTVSYTPLNALAAMELYPMVRTFDMFLRELRISCQPKQKGMSAGGWLLTTLLLAYALFVVGRIMRIPTSGPLHPSPEYIARLNGFRAETKAIDASIKNHVFLVIGGTGFTGSGVVEDILARGAKGVKILGRSIPPSVEYPYYPGKEGRYPLKGVEYIKGDVTDTEALAKAMKGTTVVVHTAASYGDPMFGSRRGAAKTEKINVGGMHNIWEAAKNAGTVKQIVYISSADTVFSHLDYTNATETAPYRSLGDSTTTYSVDKYAVGDQYSRTKIMSERWLLSKDKEAGIRTVSLRPNGIYGPGENTNFVKAVNPGWALGVLPFYFDTEQRSDWTCLYNLVFSTVLAVHKLDTDPNRVGGKAYFINDDYLINSAAWEIFKPHLDALGVPIKLWLKLPRNGVTSFGWALEVLHDAVISTTGIDIWNPVFLSYKEGLKSITTHTHEIARAKADLGYRPLLSTPEGQAFAAEECARRYGVKKA